MSGRNAHQRLWTLVALAVLAVIASWPIASWIKLRRLRDAARLALEEAESTPATGQSRPSTVDGTPAGRTALAPAVPAPPPERTIGFTGRVVDSRRLPVAGATVTLRVGGLEPISTASDASGGF